MNITDLKGHLLARRGNLQQANKTNLANVLLAESRLNDLRAELGASQGALAELDRTLELLEKPEMPAPTR